ncbi:hypothetical protein KY284_008393 [Solanum tuberosum]|nr:hypothetical protein KY284_008393 [Solanum tuberosum]
MEAISSPDESLAMEEQDYVNFHHNDQIPIINQEININSHNNKRILNPKQQSRGILSVLYNY